MNSSIVINGNSELKQQSSSGNGTSANPYILENKTINANASLVVQITNTNAYFIFRNSYMNFSNFADQFYIENVTHGTFENCTITRSRYGFNISNSSFIIFKNDSISNTFYPFYLNNVTQGVFDNCSIDSSLHSVYILNSGYITFENSTMNSFIDGFYLTQTNNSQIQNNNINTTTAGFSLFSSSENILRNNSIHFLNQFSIAFPGIEYGGINLYNSKENLISFNYIDGGSKLYNSDENVINSNYFNGTDIFGINILNSNSSIISNNQLNISFSSLKNLYIYPGIILSATINSTITNNSMITGGIQFAVPIYGNQYLIENNSVDNRPIVFMQNQNNFTISQQTGQIILSNCSSITVKNQNFINVNVTVGIQSFDSSNGFFINNTFKNSNLAMLFSHVSNYTIKNSTISRSVTGISFANSAGISISKSDNFSISFNSFANTAGVSISNSNNFTISENSVNNAGIGVSNSKNFTISENSVINASVGISNSINFEISSNDISFSQYDGLGLANSSTGYIFSNTVSFNKMNGIELIGSKFNIFYNNTITNNLQNGIYIQQLSKNNKYFNNIINNNNESGMYIFDSSFETISNNILSNNTINGIHCYLEQNSTIMLNNFTQNHSYGINMSYSYYNVIFLNSFIDNGGTSSQAFSDSNTNQFTNGTYGNYWSDYTGTSANSTSYIGTTPYNIDGGSGTVDPEPLTVLPQVIENPTNTSTSSTTATNSQLESFNVQQLFMVILFVFLIGIAGMAIWTFLDYKKLVKNKTADQRFSLKDYVRNKFKKNKSEPKPKAHLSDETLKELEDIIDESNPK